MPITVLVVVVIIALGLTVIGFVSRRVLNTPTKVNIDDSPQVSVERMDKVFRRSAGRYCQHCGIHGSHHTDRHKMFAKFVVDYEKNRGHVDLSSIVKVKSS